MVNASIFSRQVLPILGGSLKKFDSKNFSVLNPCGTKTLSFFVFGILQMVKNVLRSIFKYLRISFHFSTRLPSEFFQHLFTIFKSGDLVHYLKIRIFCLQSIVLQIRNILIFSNSCGIFVYLFINYFIIPFTI